MSRHSVVFRVGGSPVCNVERREDGYVLAGIYSKCYTGRNWLLVIIQMVLILIRRLEA